MKFNPMPKIPSKKESISKLKKQLDKVFNEFIRLRDDGKPCISCGKFSKLQAGHYHSCRYLSIRWDETNVNGQCISCNIFNQGAFHGYTKGIISKYGKNALERLEIKKNNLSKMGKFEYGLLINEYECKVKYLKSIKK